jgi:hypothetical protein
MAKQARITVELSAEDRRLLKQLIKAVGIEPEQEDAAETAVRRLVESEVTVSGSDFGDPALLDNHIEADVKGHVWSGHGWVPKSVN